jgi:hypothetical protein
VPTLPGGLIVPGRFVQIRPTSKTQLKSNRQCAQNLLQSHWDAALTATTTISKKDIVK